jgi:hypothetical protein
MSTDVAYRWTHGSHPKKRQNLGLLALADQQLIQNFVDVFIVEQQLTRLRAHGGFRWNRSGIGF